MCRKITALLLFLFCHLVYASEETYSPDHASISKHSLPEWYQDAKFGIIIHYGLYTVPGWAPLFDPTGKVLTKEFFLNNPYPEWYLNTMQIQDSPTQKYHFKNYGKDFKYDDFVPLFNKALNNWNPDTWSTLFASSGAKYIVFVTKHHDGFLLWPSKHQNPYKNNYVASRDVVGELTSSVRKHGMRMGLYYSGGYDWTWADGFNKPIIDTNSAINRVPQSLAYADYVNQHWHELIENYHPDLLWNDIALPSKVNKFQLFSDFYNLNPEGVVNNRWGQGQTIDFTVFGQPADILIDLQRTQDWFDYYSPEYLTKYILTRHKWEADHGPGYAFGYNREEYEHPEHLKTVDQLIEDLVDLVSKNGNLLLGIGPEADGTIPLYQRNLLLGIGDWLDKNGEAIYATEPWLYAEGSANNGSIPLRFTQSKNGRFLYVILTKNPMGMNIIIKNLKLPIKKIEILNGKNPIAVTWHFIDNNLKVYLPQDEKIPKEHPMALRIERDIP